MIKRSAILPCPSCLVPFQFSCSVVSNSATSWTAAHQASLSITSSWSLLKLMSIESVMPSNHLILCHPLLLLPSIFPSIRVFSSDSVLCIRCCGLFSPPAIHSVRAGDNTSFRIFPLLPHPVVIGKY